MSQWAEIRQLHMVEGVAVREIARRLDLDVKTVRRALKQPVAKHKRRSPLRKCRLDPLRERIEAILREEPDVTAKRVGRLLEGHGDVPRERALREYVSKLRMRLFPPEAFVHRTHAPGATAEFDFGESRARIAGKLRTAHYLVGTLPASNVYFAKAYPAERLECLLDGMLCAFAFFGGAPKRAVLDNTSLAVREVLRGRERLETQLFEGFRGAFPLHADFCAPASGWEKGSVERGVEYVRDNVFRPTPTVESWDELNALIVRELERDLDLRKLPDGRTARQALIAEREHLRPLPTHAPQTCRVVPVVADKFAHVRVDCATYSVPILYARRTLIAKLFHDRVVFALDDQIVSSKPRSFEHGAMVLDALDVLPLLERKHRAVAESTAVQQWDLPQVFHDLRQALASRSRKPDQEWVRVMLLLKTHDIDALTHAVAHALARGAASLETIKMLLEQSHERPADTAPPSIVRADLLALEVATPRLAAWDEAIEVRP